MVTHDTRESSPVRLRPSIGDQLVVNLPREREVRHAGVVYMPQRPTTELVDGGWWNPKPALARAAPVSPCLLRASRARHAQPWSVVHRSSRFSSRDAFSQGFVSLASCAFIMRREKYSRIVRRNGFRPEPLYRSSFAKPHVWHPPYQYLEAPQLSCTDSSDRVVVKLLLRKVR